MKLTELNQEQKDFLVLKKEEIINDFLSYQEINKEKAIEVITFVYSLINKPCPKIYVVASPMAAQILANKLKNTEKKAYPFGTYLTSYWASFYAFYEVFWNFGIIDAENFPKYAKLRDFLKCGFDYTIEFENAIIISEKQIEVLRNDSGLHSLSGPAIKWKDGFCLYFINGRSMPFTIFEKFISNSLTKNDFIKEANEDVRAGIYELIESKGEGSMLSFLGATEMDSQDFLHENGEIENMKLYITSEKFEGEEDLNGKSPAPLAWLKMSCPSTGTNYLIPTDSSFSSCIDAAKYHRPNVVPENIDYKWNDRN